jgi:tRNA A-37 threonylcarbamoyl transferase component Bud32
MSTKIFRKDVSSRSESQIKNEVELQKKASLLGLSPKIIATDYKTYIDMEDLGTMCIADMYGEDIRDMPEIICRGIYDILKRLYLECDIEYVDITPYNFIETEDQLWIIDFGDARSTSKKDWFLKEVFQNRTVLQWNPDFL